MGSSAEPPSRERASEGQGPFLWLSSAGPRAGFWTLPPNGMCVSAFLFVVRDGKLLLGKYADDPRWETLTGLDADRWRTHGRGWTIPASHLKFGEAPREAARRIAEDVLGLRGARVREAGVESDHYVPARFPQLGMHYDLWLFYEAEARGPVAKPAWYDALEFHDPRALPAGAYARGHEDVVARWLARRAR